MLQIKDMAPAIRAQFEEGINNELVVEEWLHELGYETKDSTQREDYCYDIDLYARKRGTTKWFSVSIKTNQPKYFNSAFSFELEKYSKKHEEWSKSWYYEGRAELYLFFKRNYTDGGELWCLRKSDVQKYVELNGWDRECGLRPEVLELQKQHNQTNTRLALIQKQNAIESGVARLLDSKKHIDKSKFNESISVSNYKEW